MNRLPVPFALDRGRAAAAPFGTIALTASASVPWIVIAAVCVYLIAYRFYSRFIASKVMQPTGCG